MASLDRPIDILLASSPQPEGVDREDFKQWLLEKLDGEAEVDHVLAAFDHDTVATLAASIPRTSHCECREDTLCSYCFQLAQSTIEELRNRGYEVRQIEVSNEPAPR